jgi:hypothetical protein
LVGDLVLVVTGQMSMEEALLGAAIGIIPGGKLLKMLAKSGAGQALGRVGVAAWGQAGAMASRGGAFLRRQANGLAERAGNLLRRKPNGACGCFTGATLVWTAQGMVPIADVRQGQTVYAAAENGQASDFENGTISAIIFIGEASLVKLTVRHTNGSIETTNTTDEHPFHIADTQKWARADRLEIGDRLSTIAGTSELIAVELGSERSQVYNLSILGSPTYYIGHQGLWVHNCGAGLHHLIPMYLGGAKSGSTKYLTSTQHTRLHVLINQAGESRGIPKHSGPGNGRKGVTRWAAGLEPEVAEQKIRETLIEAYQRFDAEQGTNLFADMYHQLLGGPIR